MTRPREDLFTRLITNYKIDPLTDCWEWQLSKNKLGYGFIRDEQKMRTTHRVSYELHNNTTIPKNLCVCHSCDNRKCINPKHLWLGTRQDNTRDMIRKGRSKFYNTHTGTYVSPMKGKKQPVTLCKYCNKSFGNNVYARWHGNKCKLNV